ncbi:unnamed protein product [Citrullus colocynthis]|uniref:Uncharacterized protein n=1 Tax=Citrullus colocynthis TaxID=252529 RepID=A0ABP0Y171_9ROSI
MKGKSTMLCFSSSIIDIIDTDKKLTILVKMRSVQRTLIACTDTSTTLVALYEEVYKISLQNPTKMAVAKRETYEHLVELRF